MVRNSPNEHAKDHKGEVLKGNDNDNYASIADKNGVYKWKKINEDMTNAIDKFKFWHTKEEVVELFKYDQKKIMQKLKSLKKELLKDGIHLYYLDYMGKWYDGELHFIDYLWDEVMDLIKDEGLGDDDTVSFIFTDDIYLLRALQDGELIFQHSILSKDVDNLKKTIKNIMNIEMDYSSNESIIFNIEPIE